MTCIIALEHEGKVYMGCDSAAVVGWEVRPSNISKVFEVQDLLIGYTDSFRMGQLIRHNLEYCKREKEQSPLRYLITVFIPALRKCLTDGGYSKIENNEEEGGTFFVGYQGKLYTVYSDYQVHHYSDGLDAIGSGRAYALGAMKAFEGRKPKESILCALDIAGHYCGSVAPPYSVRSL